MADAPDLGSGAPCGREGSSPSPSTVADARTVERLVVAQEIAGSNPVGHPTKVDDRRGVVALFVRVPTR